jgi:hypothetical protein
MIPEWCFFSCGGRVPFTAIRLVGGGKPPEPVWVSDKPGPQEPSPIYYRGLLYSWMDNGIHVCLDGKMGKDVYRKRLGAPNRYMVPCGAASMGTRNPPFLAYKNCLLKIQSGCTDHASVRGTVFR